MTLYFSAFYFLLIKIYNTCKLPFIFTPYGVNHRIVSYILYFILIAILCSLALRSVSFFFFIHSTRFRFIWRCKSTENRDENWIECKIQSTTCFNIYLKFHFAVAVISFTQYLSCHVIGWLRFTTLKRKRKTSPKMWNRKKVKMNGNTIFLQLFLQLLYTKNTISTTSKKPQYQWHVNVPMLGWWWLIKIQSNV
jgi:hypothetical protein